jgi:uncharacterized protein (DUF924 family)
VHRSASSSSSEVAAGVIAYWRRAGEAGQWFRKDPAFDRDFAERFAALHEGAARGELDAWADDAEGALALLILLDQYPRNAFRGSARMYATDAQARRIARAAIDAGHFERVDEALRLFFCLPFAHSEDLADQDVSVALNTRLGAEALRHAEGHRDIVRRFGRFPHRNALLGRETTPDEAAFLADGGFAG